MMINTKCGLWLIGIGILMMSLASVYEHGLIQTLVGLSAVGGALSFVVGLFIVMVA